MQKPILLDLPETIETERLILEVPKAGYGRQLHHAMIDGYQDYVHWLHWPSALPTEEMVEEDCRRHHAQFILREDIRYLVILKSNNQVIGRCGFPAFQCIWQIPQFGISYFISKSQRGHNYGQEVVHALTVLAFKVMQAKKVEVRVDAENQASAKIPKNLKFTLECRQKGGWPRQDGTLAELLTYARFDLDDLPSGTVKW